MPWMVSIDEMENICNEIEKTLNACEYFNAIAIVRTKFCTPRDAVWVDDVSGLNKCELSLLDWSSMGDSTSRIRGGGSR